MSQLIFCWITYCTLSLKMEPSGFCTLQTSWTKYKYLVQQNEMKAHQNKISLRKWNAFVWNEDPSAWMFFKWANTCLFLFIFVLFKYNFTSKIVDFSGIRTQIVGEEGEHADHLTTTRAQASWIVSVICLFWCWCWNLNNNFKIAVAEFWWKQKGWNKTTRTKIFSTVASFHKRQTPCPIFSSFKASFAFQRMSSLHGLGNDDNNDDRRHQLQ